MTIELFHDNPYERKCDAVVESVDPEARCFCVDQTVFYPMGGGQPGDEGIAIRGGDGAKLRIVDTRRDADTGNVLHYIDEKDDLPAPGDGVIMRLDWERRYRLMRMHSCMHLLCALIPAAVTGGQIDDGRGRLDFDLVEAIDKKQLQLTLNQLIFKNAEREISWISDEELESNPRLVRTMSARPPRGAGKVRLVHFKGVDLQPCGGTHVENTMEIGRVLVEKVEKKGRKNRRITIVFDKEFF